MIFALYSLLCYFCLNSNGLIIKFNEERILKRSITNRLLKSGLNHILELGRYKELASLLRFPTINIKAVYYKSFQERPQSHYHLINIYFMCQDDNISKEDRKTLLPLKVINNFMLGTELSENDINYFPLNPLSYKFFEPSSLNSEALNSVILRGIVERDPLINWSALTLIFPVNDDRIWGRPEIWQILMNESFCGGNIHVKKKFLEVLKSAINTIDISFSTDAAYKVFMINVSLLTFYMEIVKIKRALIENGRSGDEYYNDILNLDLECDSLINQIGNLKVNLNLQDDEYEIFNKLTLYSARLAAEGSESLHGNYFYYSDRINLFESIIKTTITKTQFLFPDWFCNLYSGFVDVIPKMSFELLMKSWEIFIITKASIGSICYMLSFFKNLIDENFRFLLAKKIPNNLLLDFYQNCSVKIIPDLFKLIPYEIRRTEHLKINRKELPGEYFYNLKPFWRPNFPTKTKILKIFEFIIFNEINLFETSLNLFFIFEKEFKISFKRFIELILETFLEIKEWYIPLDLKESDHIRIPTTTTTTTIIPSVLFPPQFMSILAKLIVRCRHLSCKNPFNLSEKFLMMTMRANRDVMFNSPSELRRLTKNHLRYLQDSNVTQLPRLNQKYQIYLTESLRIYETESIYQINFIKNHSYLSKIIKQLWHNQHKQINTEVILKDIEENILEIVRIGIDLFSEELELLLGTQTFAENELHKFLFT